MGQSSDPNHQGSGPETGSDDRVNRGGSWNNNAQNCRSANRNRNAPGNRNNNVGFRPAPSPSSARQAGSMDPASAHVTARSASCALADVPAGGESQPEAARRVAPARRPGGIHLDRRGGSGDTMVPMGSPSPLLTAAFVSLALLSTGAGCHARLLRTEGSRIPLEPREDGVHRIFAGEGSGPSRARAVQAAEADARGRALESVEVRLRSEVKRETKARVLDDVVTFDDKLESDLTSVAEGSLRGVEIVGEPYVEVYADGAHVARVAVRVTRAELDSLRLIDRALEREAMDARRGGMLDSAAKAFWALGQLRPGDPLPFVQLARVEEQLSEKDPSSRVKALEHLRQALALNGGRGLVQTPEGSRIDIASEIERLTPHWEEFLDLLRRLEAATGKTEGFSIRTSKIKYTRGPGAKVDFRMTSAEAAHVALFWIDEDGLYRLDLPEDGEKGLSLLRGTKLLEQDLGTRSPVTLVLIALDPGALGDGGTVLGDIEKPPVDAKEPPALTRLARLRALLQAQHEAGALRVAITRFEVDLP